MGLSHKPDFSIIVDGISIDTSRILSIEINDEAGFKSDTLRFTLDNQNQQIKIPVLEKQLICAIGYQGALVNKGDFTADEVVVSSPDEIMSVSAKSANINKLKNQKTKLWGGDKPILLSEMVAEIAQNNNLRHAVGEKLKLVAVSRENQTNESDMNFITRIAKQHNGVAKIAKDKLVLSIRGQGEEIDPISINRTQATSWRLTRSNRSKFKSVEARWRDIETNKVHMEKYGAGSPVNKITKMCKDKLDAQQQSKAKFDLLQRSGNKLNIVMPGDANITAETPLSLLGFSEIDEIDWVVTRVSHKISGGGFTTAINAEIESIDKKEV